MRPKPWLAGRSYAISYARRPQFAHTIRNTQPHRRKYACPKPLCPRRPSSFYGSTTPTELEHRGAPGSHWRGRAPPACAHCARALRLLPPLSMAASPARGGPWDFDFSPRSRPGTAAAAAAPTPPQEWQGVASHARLGASPPRSRPSTSSSPARSATGTRCRYYFEPALLDARPTGASRFSAALRGRGKQPRATLEHYDVVPAWDLDDPQLDTCVARHQPERDPAGPSRQAPPCRGPCRQLLALLL